MKAILRWGTSLSSLLLLSSVSFGQIAYSPVFKAPLQQAPRPSFYLPNGNGGWTGPFYSYNMPPMPFNGFLPGPTGLGIMNGGLSHELLLSKRGMDIGDMPLLKKYQAKEAPQPPTPPGGGGMGPMAGGPMPYPPMAGGPKPYPPMAGGPMPYPMMGGSPMAPPNMQAPYGAMPMSPYPMQPPYAQPMPMQMPMMPYAGMMPYPQPQPMPLPRPIAYMPYYGQPGMYANARQDPQTGIWQVQNVMPGQGATPFRPIPGFNPGGMPQGMPMQGGPMMQPGPMQSGPMMPPGPMMPQGMGAGNGFPAFDPFGRIQGPQLPQGPQPPQMNMTPMQLPRMEMAAPPPRPGGAYPTHPFTRSPRDFFMWGESMDDERARGSRPFPVP